MTQPIKAKLGCEQPSYTILQLQGYMGLISIIKQTIRKRINGKYTLQEQKPR